MIQLVPFKTHLSGTQSSSRYKENPISKREIKVCFKAKSTSNTQEAHTGDRSNNIPIKCSIADLIR